jgi:hypothetical protein
MQASCQEFLRDAPQGCMDSEDTPVSGSPPQGSPPARAGVAAALQACVRNLRNPAQLHERRNSPGQRQRIVTRSVTRRPENPFMFVNALCNPLRPALAAAWAIACALLLGAGGGLSKSAQAQDLDFVRDCMRVVPQGLLLETSSSCVAAFRSQPAARQQFVQIIQDTMALAESARVEPPGTAPAAQALKRLFGKASMESGRVVGTGGAYYGAQ